VQEKRCPKSDISPCPAGDGGEVWTKHPLQWPNITEGANIDHPMLEMLAYEEDATAAGPAATLASVVNKHFGESEISLSGTS
jgi:hypothetical protein